MYIHVHPINLDASLLVSILPTPAFTTPIFTFLIDPWLHDTITNIHPLFNTFTHSKTPPISSLASLPHTPSAVLISQSAPDHCCQQTLTALPTSTPIYAVPAAADIIKSWNHFTSVQPITIFSTDKPDTHTSITLPNNHGTLEVILLPALNWYEVPSLYSFFSIRFVPPPGESKPPFHMVFTGHGAPTSALTPYLKTLTDDDSIPPIDLLCHPLTKVILPLMMGGEVVHGKDGLEGLLKEVQVERVLAVHDEEKNHTGLVSWVIKEVKSDVKDVGGVEVWRVKEGGWGWEVEGGKWNGRELEGSVCCPCGSSSAGVKAS
ncbi:hypothetical protein BJ508DRAFT_358392 [Ascobolus immersus RN42]|uniref:Metallo-beta-lactamase domain-containing protein n=1 Tax=Ascobolus immersus RN42 TaxID=1160509 RepID=A0A3N4IKB9_ASCIM|nr:hypothetical protein BJ508DRAFT_358392 [Ascobolus immersus RN42]